MAHFSLQNNPFGIWGVGNIQAIFLNDLCMQLKKVDISLTMCTFLSGATAGINQDKVQNSFLLHELNYIEISEYSIKYTADAKHKQK